MSFIKEDFELQLNKQLIFDSVSVQPERPLHFCPPHLLSGAQVRGSEGVTQTTSAEHSCLTFST